MATARLKTDGINELYQMENPTWWFSTLKDQVPTAVYETLDVLMATSFTLHGTSVKADFRHLKRERNRITINRLPSTIEKPGIEATVRQLTGDQDLTVFKIIKHINNSGKLGALCDPVFEAPH